MGILGKLLGGSIIEPIVDATGKVLTEKERTKQEGYKAWAKSHLASAAWRPWLARTLGWCVVWYVLYSSALNGYLVLSISKYEPWVKGMSVQDLIVMWTELGTLLFWLAGAVFTTTIGSRGGEKITKILKRKYDERIEQASAVGAQRSEIAAEPVYEIDDIARPIRKVPGVSIPVRKPTYPDNGFRWGKASKRRLARADQKLQLLYNWILKRSPYDLGIIESTRNIAIQKIRFDAGASLTMKSRHLEVPAMAVDYVVLGPDGKPALDANGEWDLAKYYEITDLAKEGAKELGIEITCGIDWPTLVDGPHIELSRVVYPYTGPNVQA